MALQSSTGKTLRFAANFPLKMRVFLIVNFLYDNKKSNSGDNGRLGARKGGIG